MGVTVNEFRLTRQINSDANSAALHLHRLFATFYVLNGMKYYGKIEDVVQIHQIDDVIVASIEYSDELFNVIKIISNFVSDDYDFSKSQIGYEIIIQAQNNCVDSDRENGAIFIFFEGIIQLHIYVGQVVFSAGHAERYAPSNIGQ